MDRAKPSRNISNAMVRPWEFSKSRFAVDWSWLLDFTVEENVWVLMEINPIASSGIKQTQRASDKQSER